MPTFQPDALVFVRAKSGSRHEHPSFIVMRPIIGCHRKLWVAAECHQKSRVDPGCTEEQGGQVQSGPIVSQIAV